VLTNLHLNPFDHFDHPRRTIEAAMTNQAPP